MSDSDYNRIRKMRLIEFIKLPEQLRKAFIAKQPEWLQNSLNRLVIPNG